MKRNIFLVIAVAFGLTMTTSCNQSQAKSEPETKAIETPTQEKAPEAIENLASDLLSGDANSEIEKGDKGEIITITEANFNKVTEKGLVLVDFFVELIVAVVVLFVVFFALFRVILKVRLPEGELINLLFK